jgi:hypothetical protein
MNDYKIYGPKIFVQMKYKNITFDIFGDIHMKLKKNDFHKYVKSNYEKYDKICIEAHKPPFNDSDKLNEYKSGLIKYKQFLLNNTNLLLLDLIAKNKINKNKIVYFDNRKSEGYPLPQTNNIDDWKIFLKMSKIKITGKIIDKNNNVDIEKAYSLLEKYALNEVRNMDLSLIKKIHNKKFNNILIICGVEHVLDFLCILSKLKYKLVYINNEFLPYIKDISYQIAKYDYLNESHKFTFDDIINTNNKQYITIYNK